MTAKATTFKLTGTTPNAPGTALVQQYVGGFSEFDSFTILGDLVGATGGTLDLYLQRRVVADGSVWADWLHFTQLAGGAAATRLHYSSQQNPAAAAGVAVGIMNDALTGAVALAANTITPGHPGDALRLVAVAGAGTSAGALVSVYVVAYRANW